MAALMSVRSTSVSIASKAFALLKCKWFHLVGAAVLTAALSSTLALSSPGLYFSPASYLDTPQVKLRLEKWSRLQPPESYEASLSVQISGNLRQSPEWSAADHTIKREQLTMQGDHTSQTVRVQVTAEEEADVSVKAYGFFGQTAESIRSIKAPPMPQHQSPPVVALAKPSAIGCSFNLQASVVGELTGMFSYQWQANPPSQPLPVPPIHSAGFAREAFTSEPSSSWKFPPKSHGKVWVTVEDLSDLNRPVGESPTVFYNCP